MKLFDSLFLFLQDKMGNKTELSSKITAILLGICKISVHNQQKNIACISHYHSVFLSSESKWRLG